MQETDGEIGKVEEFYFDDQSWTIRYLIVKTGGWLFGREVLISPQALQMADWKNKTFPVNLSKEQIRNSPDIDTDKPVSRQMEEQLYEHYPWQHYWNSGFYEAGVWGVLQGSPMLEERESSEVQTDPPRMGDLHLRSTDRVTGYHIHATDGEIGEVTDYIIDDTNWKIIFFVVKTGSWIKPGKILLSTKWIKEIQWADNLVIVNISIDAVKNSPVFDAEQLISNEYEQKLFDHYGKPVDEYIY